MRLTDTTKERSQSSILLTDLNKNWERGGGGGGGATGEVENRNNNNEKWRLIKLFSR